ncbi:unnamed protein product, partial [Ceratitis capitata]
KKHNSAQFPLEWFGKEQPNWNGWECEQRPFPEKDIFYDISSSSGTRNNRFTSSNQEELRDKKQDSEC